MTLSTPFHWLAVVLPLVHILGFVFALDAIWRARTSQGAIAWAVALVSFPYLTVPLFLLFGRNKFNGYVQARRSHDTRLKAIADEVSAKVTSHGFVGAEHFPAFRVLQRLARLPVTRGNSGELLIDGEQTFRAILEAIEGAREYVLVQFYIARDDELGRKLGDALMRKAAQGVRCFYLYDEVGSHSTSRKYWRQLTDKGVKIAPFNTRRGGWRNRFQLNFRNHRKIVVIDGEKGFVGGHNVGDDYLGKGPLGPWRDTHASVVGPAVSAIQLSFVEDWHWATGDVLELDWELEAASGDDLAGLALATGPADENDNCALMYAQLIQSANHRIWIATPYFVPDAQVLCALKLAAMRGADVRILLPGKYDKLLPYLASLAYVEDVERVGVKIYRFTPGFTHQKVAMVDDVGVAIGTANLDNRSFRLNFEITLLFAGKSMANATAKMLENDFARSTLVPPGMLATRSVIYRLGVRVARLLSPII